MAQLAVLGGKKHTSQPDLGYNLSSITHPPCSLGHSIESHESFATPSPEGDNNFKSIRLFLRIEQNEKNGALVSIAWQTLGTRSGIIIFLSPTTQFESLLAIPGLLKAISNRQHLSMALIQGNVSQTRSTEHEMSQFLHDVKCQDLLCPSSVLPWRFFHFHVPAWDISHSATSDISLMFLSLFQLLS